MQLRLFVVDAFTDRLFSGNPAAVVPLERWLPDATLQSIAAEHNLSETAFFVPQGDGFHLRWMTPRAEVELCGHATLASAHVVLDWLEPKREQVVFQSASGPLRVRRAGERLEMDFPLRKPEPRALTESLVRALGVRPMETFFVRDWYAVLRDEEQVRSLAPDMGKLAALEDGQGVVVTAPGRTSDFVSRYFVPAVGIPEDPVTGSIHCALTPLWAAKLGKTALHARQVSRRGGELFCEVRGDRVAIAGRAVRYSEGIIHLP